MESKHKIGVPGSDSMHHERSCFCSFYLRLGRRRGGKQNRHPLRLSFSLSPRYRIEEERGGDQAHGIAANVTGVFHYSFFVTTLPFHYRTRVASIDKKRVSRFSRGRECL